MCEFRVCSCHKHKTDKGAVASKKSDDQRDVSFERCLPRGRMLAHYLKPDIHAELESKRGKKRIRRYGFV